MLATERRQQRDHQILSRLDKLTYATRDQLQAIEKLGGDRNANRILARLEKEKQIASIRYDKKVYYLSGKGQRFIGSNKKLEKKWIRHTIMRNDLYIKLGMPSTWQIEVPVRWDEHYIVPDAMFKRNGMYYFVEIDNQQVMRLNYEKINVYKNLFKNLFRQHGGHPTLIWYVSTDVRRRKISEACSKAEIKYKIY